MCLKKNDFINHFKPLPYATTLAIRQDSELARPKIQPNTATIINKLEL